MNSKTRPYRQALLEALQDPQEAANYLNVALDDSPEMFRKACLNVIQARQVAKVAKRAGVTRENLYRSFSATGNPTLETLHSVLQALGLSLGVEVQVGNGSDPVPKPAAKVAHAASRRKRRPIAVA
jgi:probable addiction module antidote protein